MHPFLTILIRSLVLAIAAMALSPGTAGAELLFTFEAGGSYEDNVIGLTADNPNVGAEVRRGAGQTIGGVHLKGGLDGIPGGGGGGGGGAAGGGTVQRTGDFATDLYADIGWDHDLAEETGLVLLVSAEHKAYSTYSQFDFTIGKLSIGANHRFTGAVTGSIDASVSSKDFEGTLRDSTAYGVSASLRERVTPAFWLKESIRAEQNTSRSALYDYTGVTAGIRAGYDISDRQSLSAGYSYLVRDFKNEVPAFKLTAQVVGLDWSLELNDDWTLLAGYDHEWADSTIPNTATTNNIYTIALRYNY